MFSFRYPLHRFKIILGPPHPALSWKLNLHYKRGALTTVPLCLLKELTIDTFLLGAWSQDNCWHVTTLQSAKFTVNIIFLWCLQKVSYNNTYYEKKCLYLSLSEGRFSFKFFFWPAYLATENQWVKKICFVFTFMWSWF